MTNGSIDVLADPDGGVTQFNFSGGQVAQIVDKDGRLTTLQRGFGENLTDIVGPDGSTRNFSWNNNQIVGQVSEGGLVTTYGTDPTGRITTVNRPSGILAEISTLDLPRLATGSRSDPLAVIRPGSHVTTVTTSPPVGNTITDFQWIQPGQDGTIIEVPIGATLEKI